jgi:hypothetical protein
MTFQYLLIVVESTKDFQLYLGPSLKNFLLKFLLVAELSLNPKSFSCLAKFSKLQLLKFFLKFFFYQI